MCVECIAASTAALAGMPWYKSYLLRFINYIGSKF